MAHYAVTQWTAPDSLLMISPV